MYLGDVPCNSAKTYCGCHNASKQEYAVASLHGAMM